MYIYIYIQLYNIQSMYLYMNMYIQTYLYVCRQRICPYTLKVLINFVIKCKCVCDYKNINVHICKYVQLYIIQSIYVYMYMYIQIYLYIRRKTIRRYTVQLLTNS